MAENPYQPTASSSVESKPPIPHTASIRGEAWRGFKFGAKITAFALSTIVARFGLGMVGMLMYAMIETNGSILSKIEILEVLKGIGGAIGNGSQKGSQRGSQKGSQ